LNALAYLFVYPGAIWWLCNYIASLGLSLGLGLRLLYVFSKFTFFVCILKQQVALGELELHPEFTLMQLSVEDFENKIQVNPDSCYS
jgi:hypothetical protein